MISPNKLLTWELPETKGEYGASDWSRYGLSIGAATDSCNEHELEFVIPETGHPFPTFPVVVAHPGQWLADPELEIDWASCLHVGQSVLLHGPLPREGRVRSRTRVVDVMDKGADRGSLITWTRDLVEMGTGTAFAQMTSVVLARGDGGSGSAGPGQPVASEMPIPDRPCDSEFDYEIPGNAALLYRLNGDMNPIHSSPAAARAAGFDQPILHGLATFGIGVLSALRGTDYAEMAFPQRYGCRFTGIVFPGETVRTSVWKRGEGFSFRASVPSRETIVLDRGFGCPA